MASESVEKSHDGDCSDDHQGVDETEGAVEGVNSLTAPSQPVSLELLALVSEWRAQHGLKHDDYTRYRRYCSRKLTRTRRTLHCQCTHKRKHRPAAALAAADVTEEKQLFVSLVCAERCWSHALELKATSAQEARHKHRLLRKLRRAVKYSEELCLLTDSNRTDARSKLETTAYRDWLAGTLSLEKLEWSQALHYFSSCKAVYEQLSAVVSSAQQGCYQDMAAQLEPSLRYCRYNLQLGSEGEADTDSTLLQLRSSDISGPLADKIEEVLQQTREKADSGISEVQWLGRSVPVRSDRVHGGIRRVEDGAREVEKVEGRDARLKLYAKLLLDCQETVQSLKDEIGIEKQSKQHRDKELRLEQLGRLVDYITFSKLSYSTARSMLVLQQLSRPERGEQGGRPDELVRLYDILLQNNADLVAVPGVEEMMGPLLAMRRSEFQGYRCFYLAEVYLTAGRLSEGLALLDKSAEYVEQLERECQAREEAGASGVSEEVQNLSGEIRTKRCAALATLCLGSSAGDVLTTPSRPSGPIADSLEDYIVLGASEKLEELQLFPFPPEYRPAPCKPYFFDLALSYVGFPDLEKHYSKKAGVLSSLFKGFWSS